MGGESEKENGAADRFHEMLAGTLRFDQRTGGYSGFYSRVTLTKHDASGLGDVVFQYNRAISCFAHALLTPEVGGQAVTAATTAGPLEVRGNLSAPGWTGTERLTWGGPDLPVYGVESDMPAPVTFCGSFPEKFETNTNFNPLKVEGGCRGAWSYAADDRVLCFEFELPRTDRRDPSPLYPARMIVGLPSQLRVLHLNWGGRDLGLAADQSRQGAFVGPVTFRLETAAGHGPRLFAVGFDMGNRETPEALRGRVTAARDGGYDAALTACRDWLTGALGTFEPLGRNPEEQRASAMAAWALISNTSQPEGRFAPWNPTFPSHGHYSSHYLWDTCFQTLGHAAFHREAARNALRIFGANQEPDGKIPQFICATWNRPGESQPPLLGWAAWNLHRRSPDPELLAELYPVLARNIEWWRRERDTDGDGLMEYAAALESGWDDSPRWDHGGRTVACELNTFLVAQERCLGRMAHALGREDEAKDWERTAKRHAQRIVDRLWQPDLGQFCDLRAADGERIPVLTPAAVVPLWLRPPLPRAAARRLIEDVLLNPAHLYGEYPFPVVAYSDPQYQPHQWWRGPVWVNIAYLMLEILDAYGYAAERDAAADRLIAMIVRAGRPHELFDSATGEGMGVVDYGWTASILYRLLDFRQRGVFEGTER